jgi:hypothetical protein
LDFDSPGDGVIFYAVYYPIAGVFNSEGLLAKALNRSRRPGAQEVTESQQFGNVELAMGAVMGRYPTIGKLEINDYQMAPQTVSLNCDKATQERSTVEMVAGTLIIILLSIIMGMVIQGKGSSSK